MKNAYKLLLLVVGMMFSSFLVNAEKGCTNSTDGTYGCIDDFDRTSSDTLGQSQYTNTTWDEFNQTTCEQKIYEDSTMLSGSLATSTNCYSGSKGGNSSLILSTNLSFTGSSIGLKWNFVSNVLGTQRVGLINLYDSLDRVVTSLITDASNGVKCIKFNFTGSCTITVAANNDYSAVLWLNFTSANQSVTFSVNSSVGGQDFQGAFNFPDVKNITRIEFGNISIVDTSQTVFNKFYYVNYSLLVDATPPEVNISLNNTNLINGYMVNVTGNSSDGTGLDTCIISINQTPNSVEYFNFSLGGSTSGYCGQNFTINNNNNFLNFTVKVNDTYNNINQNSWLLSVGDTTLPTLNNCTLSSASITNSAGNVVNLTCIATDTSSNVQTMIAYLNGTINKTLTLSLTPSQTATGTYSIFSSSEVLPSTESYYSISHVNVTDSSGNKLSNTTNLDFTVTAASTGVTTVIGGGGGGESKIIIQTNGTPLLSFGTPIIQFIVLNTPTKQEKRIRFVNLGNDTFRNGLIKVKGKAELFAKPYVCDLNLNNCKTSSIEINKGQSAFLVLNGTFDRRILDGVDGVVSLNEENNRGTTFELELLVSRPPFYKVVIKPLVNLSNGKLSDLSALIIGYSGIGLLGFLIFKGIILL